MKIIIDIPEEVYECCLPYKDNIVISNECNYLPEMTYSIANGTPLPKGHGDLIDKEKLKENINGWYAFMKNICKQPYMTLKQEEIIGKIDMMTPIIEAKMLESEERE